MKKSIFLLFTSISLLSSCSSDDSDTIIDPDPTPDVNAVRLVTDPTFGNILTDADGMSLYFFSRDTKEQSECNNDCKTAWPIFYKADLTLDDGLDAADFGVITRTDGDKQNTYKGWPLYYFFNDNVAGDTNGDKVGNNWYIAKPDYSLMYAEAQLIGRDSDGNDQNFTSEYVVGDELTFYMTSSTGRTIYAFVNDTKDDNNYTAQDFSNDPIWPIFHIDIDRLPSILDRNDFGTIDVFGRTQLTYKGRPLYYFGQDTNRGDNYGVSVPSPGIWPVVNTDITPL
ncbi:Secreted repeat of unknown function [Aquimarina amphilecti]|uniref:Secreted repeat protein with Y-X4-D motif n=1 Tax=Aquimarina amphilecti TaxID=1038014 RepID=A0A1H7HJ12_AQUAM|nr:hypothetical protein [Aquimarina amphilecti]SEK50363.1 Secreted repeat of unknown function [Aquimarina amphilecti]